MRPASFLSKFATVALTLAPITLLAAPSETSRKQVQVLSTTPLFSTSASLLAKAQPDECYSSPTDPVRHPLPCAGSLRPKVNQAYVWGMAKAGGDVWFGTVANTECLVQGAYLGTTAPFENSSWACQFGSSWVAQPPFSLPAAIGDWRTPRLLVYDTAAGTQTDVVSSMPGPAQALLSQTIGIRAAGTLGGVVILAGPSLAGGVNMFAFATATRTFLSATNLPGYNNIRKFVAVNGVLYAGVGLPNPSSNPALKTGRILRWTGSVATPFAFVEVGQIESMASEMAAHEGRLFVTTWPDTEPAASKEAGLFMSPALHGTGPGLDASDATGWSKVWSASQYEPDPVTARTYGGGALASFGGYLFWGTMHVPLVSTQRHAAAYPADYPSDPAAQLTWFVQSERSISIFRGKDFASAPSIGLAYGSAQLPVYVPGTPGSWQLRNNNMGGAAPLLGAIGINNPFNNYTWTMAVYDNRLWIGTMDWSYLFQELFPTYFPGASIPPALGVPAQVQGADLYSLVDPSLPGVPESLNGIQNRSSYGIRSMVADADGLFLGMANPMNLLTASGGPLGGWELIRLQAYPPNTPAGTNVDVSTGSGTVTLCQVTTPGTTILHAFPLPGGIVVPSLLPTGFSRVKAAYGFETTATLGRCAGSRTGYGSFCVPRRGNDSGRLFELTSIGPSGPVWRDVTASSTFTTLCGTIQAPAALVFELDGAATIPALGTPGLAALAVALGAAAFLALRRGA